MARRRNHQGGSSSTSQLVSWTHNHLDVMMTALSRLYSVPASSFMTVAVIGIALALPGGLYVLISNLHNVGQNWSTGSSQISLYLQLDASTTKIHQVGGQVESVSGVESIHTLSQGDALAEFEQSGGFGNALEALKDNPLPPVIIVSPSPDMDSASLQELADQLDAIPGIELAQLDMQWLARLRAIVATAQRLVLLVSLLLGLAVLFIVGNTIRLDIQNQRAEIEISKLIGGTDAFIRRPFLYCGMWYGLFGGLTAWFLIQLCLWLLAEPISELNTLYGSEYNLMILDLATTAILLLSGLLLGLFGSWITVSRHLKAIEPS